jgi:hypothetical protein
MTNTSNNTAPVDAVAALKGQSIRATQLKPGDDYVAMLTTKPAKTHLAVKFIGFGKARDALVAIPQLKTLTDADKFWLRDSEGNEIEAYGAPGAVLYKAGDTEVRMTFFAKLVNTTALTPVKEPAAEQVAAEQTETQATVETSVEEPKKKETKAERRARQAAEKVAAAAEQVKTEELVEA